MSSYLPFLLEIIYNVSSGTEFNDGVGYNSSSSSYQSSANRSMGTSAGSRMSFQYDTSEPSAPRSQTTPPVQESLLQRWSPGGDLFTLREIIKTRPWLHNNQPEPPVTTTDNLTYDSQSRKRLPTRFDLFFDSDNNHRCLWIKNAIRCAHKTGRKEHARDHARDHFKYTPFICGGECGTVSWYVIVSV